MRIGSPVYAGFIVAGVVTEISEFKLEKWGRDDNGNFSETAPREEIFYSQPAAPYVAAP